MPVNQYLPFAFGVSANAVTPAAYALLTALRTNGFQAGTALSEQMNAVWRQSATASAGVATFASTFGLLDCLDNGDPAAFSAALKSAIDQLLAAQQHWRPGDLKFTAVNVVDTGWLAANGAIITQASQPALFARIGITYNGGGVPLGSFQLPDLRGLVPRGADDGRGLDVGRAFGSTQMDAIGAHVHPLSDNILTEGVAGAGPGGTTSGTSGVPVETGSAGGAETRMKNFAGLWLIKT